MEKPQVIDSLIKIFNFNSYLEIGIGFNPVGETWNKISCTRKLGIDPHPIFAKPEFTKNENEKIINLISKDFFNFNKEKFDIIFIDGDHNELTVDFDFKSSLSILNSNGIIVMHDVGPKFKKDTLETASGTAFKTWIKIRTGKFSKNIFSCCHESETGDVIGLVWQTKKNNLIEDDIELTWESYSSNKKNILSQYSFDEIVEKYKNTI